MRIKRFSFENSRYKDGEWAEFVSPRGTDRYKDGSAVVHRNDANRFAVYDGAINFMGDITADGDMIFAGAETEYKRSFLESALETLRGMIGE